MFVLNDIGLMCGVKRTSDVRVHNVFGSLGLSSLQGIWVYGVSGVSRVSGFLGLWGLWISGSLGLRVHSKLLKSSFPVKLC